VKLFLRVPVCNIITCEDIIVGSDNKMYISNPFTGSFGRFIKKFYTYTVIQGIPNGQMCFKIQIVDCYGEIVKETDDNIVFVKENLIRAKTKWSNISFLCGGEYAIRVLIKCNSEFEVVGSTSLHIS